MEQYVFVLAPLLIQLTFVVLNPTNGLQAPFMGESAICNFLELMTEFVNHRITKFILKVVWPN